MIDLRSRIVRRRVLVGAGIAVVAIAAVVIVLVNPFGGSSSPATSLDNGSPTSLQTVVRRDLSSQTQVSATLGYADPGTIAVPAGTAPGNVQQAQQTVATAQSALTADTQALGQSRAALAGDSRKLAADCRGANAAQSGGGGTQGGGGSTSPCVTDSQAVTTDQQSVTTGTSKVDADQRALAGAEQALADAQSSASSYGQTSTYTMLPALGRVVRRGGELYAIGGEPTVLFYGGTPAWRAFAPGMSPGRDVAELNANLHLSGNAFTSSTEAAVRSFQAAHGMQVTGTLLLGSVVFEPGAVRVTSVTPTSGAAVQAGPVLGITSTRRVVTIALDASSQTNVAVGDPVTITLPDNSTTPGHVTFVGTVATTPANSDQGGGSGSPTIEVDVTPDHPGATGRLDQAPVDVSITTQTVKDALVVPVNALLALTGGGYALEVVGATGVHQLEAVQLGLFDDADGLVQVAGASVHAGQRVVVPSS